MTKSSASLVAAGGDLAEAAALTATANKIIQDADSVGTALKTTSLRLRGTDVSVLEEEGLDSEGAVTSKSKLQSKVKALSGVDILTATGEYKSTYEILSQIADVWQDISDIDQAALLELISGKRNSSVVAAILQNPEELKAAYEDAMNAEGSALEENEKYMDSIQGKIDQFTNATQTMWSNFLDDDVIKFIVDLGTNIVKFIDKIGMIPSILSGILIYLTAFKKQNPLDWIQSITQYLKAFRGEGGLKQFLGQLLGIAPAMKIVTAETIANTVATQTNDIAKQKQILSTLGLQNATGTLSLAQKEEAKSAIMAAVANGSMDAQFGANMLAALGYSASLGIVDGQLKIVDATTKSFMATNPVGWILAIVSVIMMAVTWLSQIPSKIEKLQEKLKDLKSELSNIESEIDSINTELETTQDRIAELLAMPSLSFVEQEELEKLQQANAELERRKQIEEANAASKKQQLVSDTEAYIKKAWNKQGMYNYTGPDRINWTYGETGEILRDEGFFKGFLSNSTKTTTILDQALEDYEKMLTQLDNAPDDYTETQTNLIIKRLTEGIDMILNDEYYQNLEYGMSDQINTFLDEWYAYQYKWQKLQGISDTSSFIESIFDDTASQGIQKLKEDLTYIANDSSLDGAQKQTKGLELISNAINNTTGDYDRLKTSMDIIGITADEVARYFVQLSSAPDSSTVEGITAQYQKGVDALSKYTGKATDIIAEFTALDGSVEQITWDSLFDDNGETLDVQVSKILQGADETARTEFARIVKSVNEGNMSIEEAMSSFGSSGLVSVSKLIEESFGELNKSVFKGLEDEISGFIDTFSEFSAALEDVASSMELLNTAQEQFDNSGQVSVKTALELIKSTDRWNEILYVENGQIKLNTQAQDILAQSKLDTVKANLAEAKASIQNQLAQLGAAEATLLSAEASDVTTEAYTVYTNAMNSYTASIAGFGAALGALIEGRFGDVIGDFQSAYSATKEVQTYENNTSIAALKQQLAEVETMEDFLEGVDTVDEFENNYDFDKTPGDKKDDYESEDDRFQKEMDYWENRIGANQAKYEQLQNEIDLLESKGQKADASFYEEQIELENERKWLLEQQKAAAQAHLATLEEGSEEWWEVANTLNDIEGELDDVTASILDLQDAIGEIDTYKFEEFNTRLDNLVNKLETIRNLISPNGEEDWFDDNGNWTEAGVAVLGSQLQALEMYKQAYQETMDELAKYQPEYEGNADYYETLGIHSEQEYYDKVEELTDQQYQYAESISDTQQSVVDMYESNIDAVEKYTDALVDSYNDYIDSVKEALDAERDLYDFKKNVEKQAKDIAETERRIAALSGSTNAADIAERRKLEAQLYESRESLNDTYYDHAKTSQQNALDAEAAAYEENMSKFVEGLRTSLEEATTNMDEFLMGVTSMVMYNADTVLAKYEETNLPLTTELTNPWIKAKEAVGAYSGDALALMSQWTKDGGFFSQFSTTGTTHLTSPWKDGANAANSFKNSISTVMSSVVSNIATNVKTASGELSKLYQQIQDTEKRASNVNVNTSSGSSSGGSSSSYTAPQKKYYVTAYLDMGSRSLSVTKSDSSASAAMSAAKIAILGEYEKVKGNGMAAETAWQKTWRNRVKYTTQYYAKGTAGTKRDEWAVTDEFGDELVLVPGKDGNLSFMRKGTGVVPADLTANLMEWGQLTPDSMNLGGSVNINMINNAVLKPQYDFSFDSLVHVDNCSQDTLKDLEKMVDNKIDKFSKELNYSIKRFAR